MCLLLKCGDLWSQGSTYAFHYPLHVGDFWEYLQWPAFRETKKVTGDTLLSNGHVYQIVEHEVFGSKTITFQRISDENELFSFDRFENGEKLDLKLSLNTGDTWNFFGGSSDSGFFKVIYVGDTTVLARPLKYAVIQDFTLPDSGRPLAPTDYFLADSLGIFFHGFEGGFSELKGAIIDGKKYGVITSVEDEKQMLPENFSLSQNYPNPFNAQTRISFEIPASGIVTLRVYDLLGNEVRVLFDKIAFSGFQSVAWDGKDDNGNTVSSGVYFYRLQHKSNDRMFSLTKKLAMLR